MLSGVCGERGGAAERAQLWTGVALFATPCAPMLKLRDLLCKHVLQNALEPIATVELEKPVPALDEQRIDVYCELRAELPPPETVSYLGLLRRMAEVERRFLIEPFSATPSVEQLDDLLRKKFNLQHALKKAAKGEKGEKGAESAKPVLWIVSPGCPDDALRGYSGTPATDWPPGFYRLAPEQRTWIVVLSELPKTAQTWLLRMLGPAPMLLEALREFDALGLSPAQKESWFDLLSDVRYLLPQDQKLASEENTVMTELRQRWEREKAELRAEGRTEGRTEGRAEGQARAILSVLTARGCAVSEGVRQSVLSCQDPTTLDRWLARAITATTDTEVVAA